MIHHTYRAAGGVVVDGEDVLVLLRPSRGEVRLPKGHVEDGETDEDAALREVAEESGYDDLEVIADLGVQEVEFVARGWHVLRDEHYFLMRPRSRRTGGRPSEALKFTPTWTPVEAAARELTFEAEREWLRRALAAGRAEAP